ncbi:MAG: hypothetical protein ACE5G8_14865 [Anaerolineae bacterium]
MTGALHAARYRVRQVLAWLRPAMSAPEWERVHAVLGHSSPALALFYRMMPADRRHAVAVLQTLTRRGYAHPALQQAALLHDVGKSLGQPLPHRGLIVLLKAFWPAALNRLANAPLNCPGWRRPFVIHARHADIGAAWAKEAGCLPLAVTLIQRHQQQPPNRPATLAQTLHRQLYRADGEN